MRNLRLTILAIALIGSAKVQAQTVDEQLKQQQLISAELANEKARLGAFDPLRAVAAPDAKLATPDKAAEAALLRYELYQGLAARLVDAAFPPEKRDDAFAPILVMGSAPPTAAHWDAFVARRDSLISAMLSVGRKWDKARQNYKPRPRAQLAAAGVVTAFTTLYALFKTDQSITGAALPTTPGEFEMYVLRYLKHRFPAVTLGRFGMANGRGDAEHLLATYVPVGEGPIKQAASLRSAHQALTKAYQDEYLPILASAAGGKPENIGDDQVAAAGALMKSVLDSYDALEKDLYTVTGDTLAASAIRREGLVKDFDRTKAPILFVTTQDAALTATTKKGVFRKASTATTLTAVATANYVVVTSDAAKGDLEPDEVAATSSSVACLIRDAQPAEFLGYDPGGAPATWSRNCQAEPEVGATSATGVHGGAARRSTREAQPSAG